MKVKSFIIAGLIAATASPAFADDFKTDVNKTTGEITFLNDESAQLAAQFEQYLATRQLSEEIEAQRRKCKSKRGHWFDGYCISKNPCTSKDDADQKYCIKTFKKVQVAKNTHAADIVNTYAKKVLKWNGCYNLSIPKSKAAGQDYILCVNPADEDVRMFEFDDMSEKTASLALSNYTWAMCQALGGKSTFPKKGVSEVICAGITETECDTKLNGAFEKNACTVIVD